jgi:hypothetical protein
MHEQGMSLEAELWRGREVIAQYPPWSILGMLQLRPQEGRAG